MSKIKIVIAFILFIIIVYLSFHLIQKSKTKIEDIKDIKKESHLIVYFTLNNPMLILKNNETKPLKVGDIIEEGSLIKTDRESMIGIKDENNRFRIVISKESILLIENIEKTIFDLKSGKTYNYIDEKVEFMQKTPTITIGVRGTKFVVGADEKRCYVKVAKGKIEIERNIKIPEKIEREPAFLNENESAFVSKEENEKIEKEIGINILRLPRITREKIAANDKDIIELNNYDLIKPEVKTGKLIIGENRLPVYINNTKVGEGNIEIALNEGEYNIKIENEEFIYEEKIKIEVDKIITIKPSFRKKEVKIDNLKPIEPKKKPIIEK